MHEENPSHIEMFMRLFFFDTLNKNNRIYRVGPFTEMSGDCCGGSMMFHLLSASQEILEEVTDPKKYCDIHKVIRSYIEKYGNAEVVKTLMWRSKYDYCQQNTITKMEVN